MQDKLPADFDPQRYLAAYPDVALTGMNPGEHYLRFGRIMGRSPSGKVRAAAERPTQAQTTARALKQIAPAPQAEPSGPVPNRPNAIIDRPPDFEAEEVVPAPAPARRGADETGVFTLQALGEGVSDKVRAPLAAYAGMFGLKAPATTPEAGLGAGAFLTGDTRIENAWFTGGPTVRLMIAGGPGSYGSAVRAYQADPAAPGELRLAGPGVQLPPLGPVLHELELRHPLMPVLLELADGDGATGAFALMPFPSLLPGGLHGAELRALQSEPNPMDAFWSLSDLLLRELLGQPEWPARSIAKLSVLASGDGAEAPGLSGEVQQWITAIFGLSVEAAPASRPKRGSASKSENGSGLHLLLPKDCIPTISGLVSRRLQAAGGGRVTSPYLVADTGSARPRWSVVLPFDWDAGPKAPVLEGNAPAQRGAAQADVPPIHIAIALRPQPEPNIPQRQENAHALKSARGGLKMTVVLDATDAKRTEAVVGALERAIGAKGLDLLVRLSGDEGAVREALGSACGAAAWSTVDGDSDLPEIAAKARHDLLLTISDRVSLNDPHTLKTLSAMLEDEQVASASCVLLTEASLKKQAVLQPAAGGLFPAAVSFVTSPTLTFAEPDVLQALPDLTYPVVANTLLLTLWRRRALADLPRRLVPVPSSSSDIRIGLALADRGLRSLCTTEVCAKLAGRYVRRDAIDPIGQTYLDPQHWQQLLGRVTLLRQLF